MKKCEVHPLDVPLDEKSFSGNLTAHDLILGLAIGFTSIACISSSLQIFRHATNYTAPKEQRQIIRILLMVPVYSICCTLSIQFYKEHVYLGAIYEAYESLAIAAFFLLLCQYIRPEMADMRRVFNMLVPMDWLRPIRLVRTVFACGRPSKKDGLRWLNIVWLAIHQFCLVKFVGAILKCITEAADVYCPETNKKSHANFWIGTAEMISLVVAMLFLFQFYKQTKDALKEHNPLFKFVAIKLAIFLLLVQTFIFERLTAKNGPLQPTEYISFPSLSVGIPNAILCFEMAVVSILHIWAYPSKPYLAKSRARKHATKASISEQPQAHSVESTYSSYTAYPPTYSRVADGNHQDERLENGVPQDGGQHDMESMIQSVAPVKKGGFLGYKALLDAIIITDIFKGIATGLHWLFVARRRDDARQFDYELEQRPGYGPPGRRPMKTTDLAEAMAMA